MSRLRTLLVLAVVATAVVVPARPAPATTLGVGTFAGSGTVSPGWTTTPTTQTWTTTLTLLAGGYSNVHKSPTGVHTCGFEGSGSNETITDGAGSGSGECTGSMDVNCTFSYTRTAVVLLMTGECISNPSFLFEAVLLLAPTTTPSVQSFLAAGPVAILAA